MAAIAVAACHFSVDPCFWYRYTEKKGEKEVRHHQLLELILC